MASLEQLQTDLEAARAARLRILQRGQQVGFGDTRLQAADLAEVNKTIQSLEAQISRTQMARAGRGSLSGRVVRPGGCA